MNPVYPSIQEENRGTCAFLEDISTKWNANSLIQALTWVTNSTAYDNNLYAKQVSPPAKHVSPDDEMYIPALLDKWRKGHLMLLNLTDTFLKNLYAYGYIKGNEN